MVRFLFGSFAGLLVALFIAVMIKNINSGNGQATVQQQVKRQVVAQDGQSSVRKKKKIGHGPVMVAKQEAPQPAPSVVAPAPALPYEVIEPPVEQQQVAPQPQQPVRVVYVQRQPNDLEIMAAARTQFPMAYVPQQQYGAGRIYIAGGSGRHARHYNR